VPRDYKPRSSRRSKQRRGVPGWLWALAGLLLGLFIMGLVWLKLETPERAREWIGGKPNDPSRTVPRREEVTRPRIPEYKPRYQFYDELRRKEVVIPEERLDAREMVDPTAQYLVQVGSFARLEDADRLQAELALLGIETRVSKARLEGGRMRYRVQAGPYLGRSALDRARLRLKRNGYRDLLVRIIR